MGREFKPGDVAMVNGRVCIRKSGDWANGEGWEHGDRLAFRFADHEALDIRPLVVIDPEDAEQVRALANLIVSRVELGGWPTNLDLADALREFAHPTPPKEPEPLGLGAVVEDAEGRRFIRVEPDGGQAKWVLSRALLGEDPRHVWSAIDAVRVLSHGVTEGER